MNTFLWILQIALAAKFISVTITHGMRPNMEKMSRGFERYGPATRPLLVMISSVTLLAGAALVLPALSFVPSSIIPWAASVLAILSIAAALFHLSCREIPTVAIIAISLVLFLLSAFVAYGRWIMVPF